MESGLKQKMQEFIEWHEPQREKFTTWQHGLEETLELKIQEFKGKDKRQREKMKIAKSSRKGC